MIMIFLLILAFSSIQPCEPPKKPRIKHYSTGCEILTNQDSFKTPYPKAPLRQSVPITSVSVTHHDYHSSLPRPNQLRDRMRDYGYLPTQELIRSKSLGFPTPDDSSDASSEADEKGLEWQFSHSRDYTINNESDMTRWNKQLQSGAQPRKRLHSTLQYIKDSGTNNG